MSVALFGAIDALATALTAAIPTARVYDGPAADFGEEMLAVFVGANVDDADAEVGTADVNWAHIGHQVFDEQGAVAIEIAAWTGDKDFSGPRSVVAGAFDNITTALKTDPTLGSAVLEWRGFTGINVRQVRDGDGVRVIASTSITYRART